MDILFLLFTILTMSNNKEKRIFLDFAAATPVSVRAQKAYVDASVYFANPQALHTQGLEAARIRDDAKNSIAKILGVKSHELVSTSGGTESNNLAVVGYLLFLEESGINMKDCHVLISAIEHPSVNDLFTPFIGRGLSLEKVQPNEHGEIKPDAIRKSLRENTVLVSVALVNSEIGTVQPIHAISKVVEAHSRQLSGPATKLRKTLFHVDSCQGLYQTLTPHGLNVDLMSFDSGKMYGPRGAGILYIKQGIKISPVLRGGSQEYGLRPGTENVALMSGFAEAFKEVEELKITETERLTKLRSELISSLYKAIPDLIVNGTAKRQSPHILNISIPKIDAEYVAMYLDQRGISLTTKSACLERSDTQQSHVVFSLGGEKWRAKNTLRFSFGRITRIEDVPLIVSKVKEAIDTYRNF